MGLFGKWGKKRNTNAELEGILASIEVNANNNYKDNVRDGLKLFGQKLEELTRTGGLTPDQQTLYEAKLEELKKTYTGYFHTEQKATWH